MSDSKEVLRNRIGDMGLEITALKDELCEAKHAFDDAIERNNKYIDEIHDLKQAANVSGYTNEEPEYYCRNCGELYMSDEEVDEYCRMCSHDSILPIKTEVSLTTSLAGREQEVPANGYVLLYTDTLRYMKYGSLDELISDYVCGDTDVYELGVELKPVREVRWVEVES